MPTQEQTAMPAPADAPPKRKPGRPPIHGKASEKRVQIRVPDEYRAKWRKYGDPIAFMLWIDELEKNSLGTVDGK